ncbi:MAG: 4-hydroxy-tetrahydrodipicolinate synthase [Legionellaceae bacterium]|nr:4-hydroxy-tetrahydrodipicolinate synthase [Legionellaceae bacterium]
MFHGSMVALVTPMLHGEVDYPRLAELVEFHISEGTNAIVAAGTTGEAGTLDHAEKLKVIQTVVDQVNNRIPVIAGTAANATRDCIALTREAMAMGVHAALIMTPAYIKPTQAGLLAHYRHIAESLPLPIILYNVPGRTACDMLPETVAQLSTHSNIVGIKEASGDIERLRAILEQCGSAMDVYSGDDLSAADWILAGAKGAISVTANVAPKMMAKLCDLALDGARAETLALQEKLLPLHDVLFAESNPIPVKWAVSKLGLMSDEIRLPLLPLSRVHHARLEAVLTSLNLL